jgi:putative hydroxymethylpyrimidine transport system substrate-binding protein
LIILSSTTGASSLALPKFLGAVKEGADYLVKNVEPMWAEFAKDQTSLNNKLNKASWDALPGCFSQNPFYLDAPRYTTYRDFMFKTKLIKQSLPLDKYAVEIKA